MDRGRDAARAPRSASPRPGGPPSAGRDVEALGRRVDDPAVRHHRNRIDGLEALGKVDGQHGEHAEAGELGRAAHVTALDERARLPGLGAGPLDPVGRQPTRHAGRGDNGAVALARRGELLLGAVLAARTAAAGTCEVATIRTLPPTSRARRTPRRGSACVRGAELSDRDVDLRERGLRRRVRHHPAGHRGHRLGPVAAARGRAGGCRARSSSWLWPGSSARVSSRRGFALLTSTAFNFPFASA